MSSIIHGGLDVHKEYITACLMDTSTGEVFTEQVPNDRAKVLKAVEGWKKLGELDVCYEAGGCGYVLHRWLTGVGVKCNVIAPSLVPKAPGDKVKTDRRDAQHLAKFYAAGMLKNVRVPDEEQEAVRALVRQREEFTADVVRQKNRIIKYIRTLGKKYTGGYNWTKKHRQWLKEIEVAKLPREILDNHLRHLASTEEIRDGISKRIEEIAQTEPYLGLVEKLKCLRGVGTQTAMVLVTEIGDIWRFGKAGELMSYFGLVGREYSSGGKRKTGSITKCGSGRVRRVMVEAAWHQRRKENVSERLKKQWASQPEEVVEIAKKAQKRLHQKFMKVSATHDRRVAATAVAREMVGFVWAILRAEAEGPVRAA
jgi:transposase